MSSGLRLPSGQVDENKGEFQSPSSRTIRGHQVQHARHENSLIRLENETLRAENLRLRNTLSNSPRRGFGGPNAVNYDLSFDEQHLQMENARLRDEIDQLTIELARRMKNPMPWVSQTGVSQNEVAGNALCASGLEKQVVSDVAYTAMDELIFMTQTLEPLWIPVSIDGYTTYLLNEKEYSRSLFRAWSRRHGFRSEATRASAIVKTDHTNIITALMDLNQWATLFCAIVAKAIPLEKLATWRDGSYDGALEMVHAEYQIITPLIPTRETTLVRYCKQRGEGIWAVVDVSLDEVEGHSVTRFQKPASGCVIQQLRNGYSEITWIEHIEVEDKGNDGIYRSVILSGVAFGAKYWLSILNGQFERC